MGSTLKYNSNKKGNRRTIACCLFLFLISPLFTRAQTHGTLEVVKDPRIDTIMMRRLEPVKSYGGGSTGSGYISANGYRVQFFSSTNRAEAYNAQQRFNERFPELRTYITYREPNFKVRAGDFRTRLEATKYLQQIRTAFPTLIIISEKINPPSQ